MSLEPGSADDTLAADGVERRTDGPLAQGESVGRYVILHQLGAGGMGVVYAAYDPRLDRKVALKLLHPGLGYASEGPSQLLFEAQAMAKLNHPNVVAAHDVGEHAGQVFLAMEFIDGQTLVEWAKGRSWREIVAAYVAAALGLAAAHAQGLVHRDFKPDNVMVGADGRVRVMDFGLAHGAEARTLQETPAYGTLAGTPSYMAPEQYRGEATTPASDQFSFCVALYESLYGQRPFVADNLAALALAITQGRIQPPPAGASVPGHIRKLLLRGLAVDPGDRFASMTALATALGQDPALRRRWALGGVLAVAMIAGAWWLGDAHDDERDGSEVCQAMERHLDGVWDPSSRDRLERGLLDSGAPLAQETWVLVERHLDGYARAWLEGRSEACEATRIRGEQSAALMDKRMACYDARLEEFAALVDVLADGGASVVERAVLASASMPPLARCADVDALLAELPPPDDPEVARRVVELRGRLAEVRALEHAAKNDEAMALVVEIVAEARTLGHDPTLARALVQRGDTELRGSKPADAEPRLIEGFQLAVAHGDRDVMASSTAMLVRLLGQKLARAEEARVWAVHALALAELDGSVPARANILTALGLTEDAAGDYERARGYYEQVLELRRGEQPPNEVGLGVVFNNLGNVAQTQANFAQAREYHEQALQRFRANLGPNHQHVSSALNNLGVDARGEGRLADARAYYEQALEVIKTSSGPRHPSVASISNNLGGVANELGDYAAAREYFETALDIVIEVQGPEHPNVGKIEGNLAAVAWTQGDYASSLEHATRGIEIIETALGSEYPSLAFGLTAQGRALVLLGRSAEALAPLQRALELRTTTPSKASDLAETRAVLGRALWHAPARQGRDRQRARELGQLARAAYEEAGEIESVASIDAWLTPG